MERKKILAAEDVKDGTWKALIVGLIILALIAWCVHMANDSTFPATSDAGQGQH